MVKKNVKILILCLFAFNLLAANLLTLEDYVRLALRQSDQAYSLKDSIATSELAVAAAEHAFDITWVPLARIGTFSGTGQQQLGIEARKKTGKGTDIAAGISGSHTQSDVVALTNTHSLRAYVKFSQGLFRRWGEKYNRLGLTQAEMQNEEQRLKARRSSQDIILDAVRRYYNVVLAQRTVGASEQSLKRSREILEASRARQAAGLVSKQDVYRAELAVLNAENALEDRRRALRDALEALHELIGLSGTGRIAVDTEIRELVPVLPRDWKDGVLERRADWLAYKTRLKISELALYKAQRDLLPDISLDVMLERKGLGNSFGEASSLDESNWSVQLELRSTLDNFQEKLALSRERINAARLKREGQALKRKIQREARNAMEDLQADERRYRIAVRKLEQARQSLELARIRYERGLSDNLDLIDAQTAYAEAELEILRSRVAYNIGVVELGHAIGVLDMEWLTMVLHTPPGPAGGQDAWPSLGGKAP